MRRLALSAATAALSLFVGAATASDDWKLMEPPGLVGLGLTKPKTQCAAGTALPVGSSTICGVMDEFAADVVAYKGIKYGEAKRWQDSEPYALSGNVKAVEYGKICPQLLSPAATKAGIKTSEDCLFLNVWRPKNIGAGNLPVMVFIHGGAFVTGAGSDVFYDGGALAAHGAIVVSLNYRLGALGFLAANKYGVDAVGNYGLRDQRLALHWVNDNIAAFGGDVKRITIFGESAGAMSVALHLFDIPSSKDLFQNALMESNVGGSVYRTPDEVEMQGEGFLDYLCSKYGKTPVKGGPCIITAAMLKVVPYTEIAKAQFAFVKSSPKAAVQFFGNLLSGQTLPWAPVVNGSDQLVVGQPYQGFAPGMPAKTFAFGVNQDEGALFVGMGSKALAPYFLKKPSNFPSVATYNEFLKLKFKDIPDAIDTIKKASPERYDPAMTKGTHGYSASGAAMANVFTDYVFACGDLMGADAALGQGATVYAYQFTQPIFFSITRLEAGKGHKPADAGACDPGQGLTCHGTELPYVFDTLDIIPRLYPNYQLGPTDDDVAKAMNQAWFDFAANPGNPGSSWQRYMADPQNPQNDRLAYRWDGADPGHTVRLGPQASCPLWAQQPYPAPK